MVYVRIALSAWQEDIIACRPSVRLTHPRAPGYVIRIHACLPRLIPVPVPMPRRGTCTAYVNSRQSWRNCAQIRSLSHSFKKHIHRNGMRTGGYRNRCDEEQVYPHH